MPRARTRPVPVAFLAGLFLGLALSVSPGLLAPAPAAAGDEPTEQDRALCQQLMKDAVRLLETAERTGERSQALAAAALLDRARRLCPDDPDIPFNLALAYVIAKAEDRTRESMAVLENTLLARATANNQPATEARGDPRLLYVRARVHFTFGNNPFLAIQALTQLRARDPRFLPGPVSSLTFRCHLAYANQLVFTKDYEGAIAQARLAETFSGTDPKRRDIARRNLAQILRFADRLPESQAIWEDLVARYPNDAILRYGLASTLADQFRFPEACDQWKEVMRLRSVPGSVDDREADQLNDAPMRYGVSMLHAGRLEPGKAQMLEYAKDNPNDARIWFHLGLAGMEQLDDPDHAIEWLEKARAIDPWCEATLRALLVLYTNARRDEGRAKALQATLDDMKIKIAREREMDRRKATRPDRTTGCD